MYLLYLDESGTDSCKIGDKDRYYILAGIAIHEGQLPHLREQLDELAGNLKNQHAFDKDDFEFHAQEIHSGKKIWRKVDPEKRKIALEYILKRGIFQKLNPEAKIGLRGTNPLFGVAVDKQANVLQGDKTPLEYAFEQICSRFSKFLGKHSKKVSQNKGLIIYDNNSAKTKLETSLKIFRDKKQGTQFGYISGIDEIPLFIDSKKSRGIQYADAIAYAMKRFYDHKDNRYLKKLEQSFDYNDGRVDGLLHMSDFRESCECPYCKCR